MPSIIIHSQSANAAATSRVENPLPQLLLTPGGLAILELQGTIHTPDLTSDDSGRTQSTTVGRLAFPDFSTENPLEDTAWMRRVHLYIGRHQRLTGEVKKLSNPMAVIRRRTGEESGNSGEELEIAEIIYYKILFSSRPEPVSG